MTQLNDMQRSEFLGHVDRLYRSLNSVARFARANKIDLDDPFDQRSLNTLAVAAQSISAATEALLQTSTDQPRLSKK